jgi:hypothetical protein
MMAKVADPCVVYHFPYGELERSEREIPSTRSSVNARVIKKLKGKSKWDERGRK